MQFIYNISYNLFKFLARIAILMPSIKLNVIYERKEMLDIGLEIVRCRRQTIFFFSILIYASAPENVETLNHL